MTVDDVTPGMQVRADGGFTCILEGAVLTIETDDEGYAFVPCREGRHYLGGQIATDGTTLSGFEPV